MDTAKTMLIAYDGSACADAAIDGLALAGLPDRASALVLSVVDAWLPEERPSGGRADEALPSLKDIRAAVAARVEAQRELAERGAARVRTIFPNWRVTADACADSPALAIIRRAEGEHGGVDGSGAPAALTVVGSRGLGAVRRAVLGSVAQKVLHGLRGSVRIGRGAASEPPPGDAVPRMTRRGEGPPPGRLPRIVVGVDGSPSSDAAVAAVAARCWPAGTRVLVACYAQGIRGLEHSHAASVSGFGAGGIWSGDVESAEGPVDSWAARTASKAASMIRVGCPGVRVSWVVRLADPSYALVDEAAEWGGHVSSAAGDADGSGTSDKQEGGADCIFVGARGVRTLERFLLGSVSTAVAMNAHCSVEITHPPAPPETPGR